MHAGCVHGRVGERGVRVVERALESRGGIGTGHRKTKKHGRRNMRWHPPLTSPRPAHLYPAPSGNTPNICITCTVWWAMRGYVRGSVCQGVGASMCTHAPLQPAFHPLLVIAGQGGWLRGSVEHACRQQEHDKAKGGQAHHHQPIAPRIACCATGGCAGHSAGASAGGEHV
jgi:hypothetical protein